MVSTRNDKLLSVIRLRWELEQLKLEYQKEHRFKPSLASNIFRLDSFINSCDFAIRDYDESKSESGKSGVFKLLEIDFSNRAKKAFIEIIPDAPLTTYVPMFIAKLKTDKGHTLNRGIGTILLHHADQLSPEFATQLSNLTRSQSLHEMLSSSSEIMPYLDTRIETQLNELNRNSLVAKLKKNSDVSKGKLRVLSAAKAYREAAKLYREAEEDDKSALPGASIKFLECKENLERCMREEFIFYTMTSSLGKLSETETLVNIISAINRDIFDKINQPVQQLEVKASSDEEKSYTMRLPEEDWQVLMERMKILEGVKRTIQGRENHFPNEAMGGDRAQLKLINLANDLIKEPNSLSRKKLDYLIELLQQYKTAYPSGAASEYARHKDYHADRFRDFIAKIIEDAEKALRYVAIQPTASELIVSYQWITMTALQAKQQFINSYNVRYTNMTMPFFSRSSDKPINELKDILALACSKDGGIRSICVELNWMNEAGEITRTAPPVVKANAPPPVPVLEVPQDEPPRVGM